MLINFNLFKNLNSVGMEIDANHLEKDFVDAYRKLERERLNGILNDYLSQCQHAHKVWRVHYFSFFFSIF